MSADTSFLNDSVTEALVEGLAATISAQPDDSVEYLGQFLLKFVERKEAEMRVRCSQDGGAGAPAGGVCSCSCANRRVPGRAPPTALR